jgi:hypothetical protein
MHSRRRSENQYLSACSVPLAAPGGEEVGLPWNSLGAQPAGVAGGMGSQREWRRTRCHWKGFLSENRKGVENTCLRELPTGVLAVVGEPDTGFASLRTKGETDMKISVQKLRGCERELERGLPGLLEWIVGMAARLGIRNRSKTAVSAHQSHRGRRHQRWY